MKSKQQILIKMINISMILILIYLCIGFLACFRPKIFVSLFSIKTLGYGTFNKFLLFKLILMGLLLISACLLSKRKISLMKRQLFGVGVFNIFVALFYVYILPFITIYMRTYWSLNYSLTSLEIHMIQEGVMSLIGILCFISIILLLTAYFAYWIDVKYSKQNQAKEYLERMNNSEEISD